VEPGSTFDYDYQLAPDHPSGMFWYHPHHHGMVADQIFGGLYGAIIVDEPEGESGSIPITRERVLVISDISLNASGSIRPPSAMARMRGREGDLVLINGQLAPTLEAHPGERERWRIVNGCTARYLRVRLDRQRQRLLVSTRANSLSPETSRRSCSFPVTARMCWLPPCREPAHCRLCLTSEERSWAWAAEPATIHALAAMPNRPVSPPCT
jgi:FtsP/CotA-like multicopper oxidase with cupredoxin domain